jgi:hypothetical protein
MEFEWFRHNRRCATLAAAPRTVSHHPVTPRAGWTIRWYTGEPALEAPTLLIRPDAVSPHLTHTPHRNHQIRDPDTASASLRARS